MVDSLSCGRLFGRRGRRGREKKREKREVDSFSSVRVGKNRQEEIAVEKEAGTRVACAEAVTNLVVEETREDAECEEELGVEGGEEQEATSFQPGHHMKTIAIISSPDIFSPTTQFNQDMS